MNPLRELSVLLQEFLLEHHAGPVPIIATEWQRQAARRALLRHGLLKLSPSRLSPRFTTITTAGKACARDLLAALERV